MVEKKTDRRILKTKRVLRESLLYLLKEQPIQKISVSLLCEKSDINRSTFYTYYSSPMDLLESIEDEILNTLEEDMIQFEKENSISQLMNSIIFYFQIMVILDFRINFCLPHSAGQCRCGRAEDRIMMQRLYLLCIFIL